MPKGRAIDLKKLNKSEKLPKSQQLESVGSALSNVNVTTIWLKKELSDIDLIVYTWQLKVRKTVKHNKVCYNCTREIKIFQTLLAKY